MKLLLLVEDRKVDAMMLRHAFDDLQIRNPIVHVNSIEEALEYLRGENNQRPGFIILDLDIAGMNGINLLKILKVDGKLKEIPVVVLTSSNEKRQVGESFDLGAAGYMIKSADYRKFVETVRAIYSYWTLSKLPPYI